MFDAIKPWPEARDAARDLISRLCHGERWTMRAPVDLKRDSDMIMISALSSADAEIKRLAQRVRELEAAIADAEDAHEAHGQHILYVTLPHDRYVEILERAEGGERG